jgi:predicted aspartyl protease
MCDDGVQGPVLPAKILPRSGEPVPCTFLVDTGADHTVIPAELLRDLGLPSVPSTRQIGGVGGVVESVLIHPQVMFLKDNGDWLTVAIQCFAFTIDNAVDMPILGRDVTNLFALIVDHASDVVCLVRDRHRYVIQEA